MKSTQHIKVEKIPFDHENKTKKVKLKLITTSEWLFDPTNE